MDTNLNKPRELDTLITIYFGQDYTVIDENGDVEALLEAYFNDSEKLNLELLLDDIKELEEQADGYSVFIKRYSFDFDPTLWGFTAQSWLEMIKSRASHKLNEICQ
ncbi:hypothetical protein FEM41_24085 [Jejubacter calystegiae]|uniref:CdiI immunity protein domain-containing protein n=1 Tax=Jejubacter calystegiae TaxID=2579935 RepID=A0A4P8YNQ5_9ENTR|nr:contact-dependent growth inhibition system immunity protein [Jejubacter calystegiae]QCT22499.1 hypothetical protein FEM41_24085 [Jejubacter calystegiae]